jgi:hypothetical protein
VGGDCPCPGLDATPVLPDRPSQAAGAESMNATQTTTQLPVFKMDFSSLSFPADYIGGGVGNAVQRRAKRDTASLAVTQVLPRF